MTVSVTEKLDLGRHLSRERDRRESGLTHAQLAPAGPLFTAAGCAASVPDVRAINAPEVLFNRADFDVRGHQLSEHLVERAVAGPPAKVVVDRLSGAELLMQIPQMLPVRRT
jgi:hypothetical protein